MWQKNEGCPACDIWKSYSHFCNISWWYGNTCPFNFFRYLKPVLVCPAALWILLTFFSCAFLHMVGQNHSSFRTSGCVWLSPEGCYSCGSLGTMFQSKLFLFCITFMSKIISTGTSAPNSWTSLELDVTTKQSNKDRTQKEGPCSKAFLTSK